MGVLLQTWLGRREVESLPFSLLLGSIGKVHTIHSPSAPANELICHTLAALSLQVMELRVVLMDFEIFF